MKARLLLLWHFWAGRTMAVQTAYSKGYDAGFLKGLACGQRTEHALGFIKGFTEGRESTRTIPLDEEEEPCPQSH